MQYSDTTTVTIRLVELVNQNKQPLQRIYLESKNEIKIFIQGQKKEVDSHKFDDKEGKKTFTFTDKEFGTKDKLELILKLPRKVTTESQNHNQPQTWKLIDSDLQTLEFDLYQGKSIELADCCYETCGGIISGKLYFEPEKNCDPQQRATLRGVKITLSQKNCHQNEQKVFEDITDAQGIYSFSDLESGYYQLEPELTLDAEKFHLDPGLLRLSDRKAIFYLDKEEIKEQCDFSYSSSKGIVRGLVFQDLDRDGNYFGSHEIGLPNVTVMLKNRRGHTIEKTETDDCGEYSFEVSPGTYTLNFSASKIIEGEEYTLTTAETQTITIKAAKTVQAKPVGYQTELHGIEGQVTYEDGKTPIEGVLVVVFDEQKNEIGRDDTDEKGNYFIDTGRSGNFIVEFPEDPFEGQLLTPNEQSVVVNSITRRNAKYRQRAELDGGITSSSSSSRGDVPEALFDIASYMPTAQDNFTPSSRGSSGDRNSSDLKYVVDSAFNEVLGRNLRNDDPKAFLASLERAFTAEEVKGKTQYTWTPRSYAVQTELGGKISGAQASLYHRAKIAIDDAIPLLDGLKPLNPDYDNEEVEAARAIVRTEMMELTRELGLEGGPRIQRVEHIFDLIEEQLQRFRKVFGLKSKNVITVEEEQNLTNFLVIEDYIKGLRRAWQEFRKDFTGIGSEYLGTQLVLLSRTLSVVAESVAEAYQAMDDVGLGPSERRTIPIRLSEQDRKNSDIYLEDLMSWIEHFASEEAPSLIQDGGKRGVSAILSVAGQLSKLTIGATQADVNHVGFRTERVKRTLRELASQLHEVYRLAEQLQS